MRGPSLSPPGGFSRWLRESFRTGGEVIEDVPVLELLDVQPVDGQGFLLIPGQ
jgi:hypothetical protein